MLRRESGLSRNNLVARAGECHHRGLVPTTTSNSLVSVECRYVDLIQHRSTVGWSGLAKSAMDCCVAGVLFALLAPLMVLIAILIKLDSPGPVFFLQLRHGLNCRKFKILKFRTMYHRDAPESDVHQCSRDDPRVTRVGRFLRRTSLDELPQIFNVLNGTMSLVGPRPHAVCHNAEYGKLIWNYNKRHHVKPGITGWAQVNNLRGETPTVASMARRVEHDHFYVDNWSPVFDLRILVATPIVVFFQESAY